MGRPQHVCPNKGCRGYALGSDDEQEGAQHHRRRGDDAHDVLKTPDRPLTVAPPLAPPLHAPL